MEKECSICLDNLEGAIVTLTCSHQYHGSCIENWFNSSIVQKDIWCRPCSQNGKFPCYRKTQKCMELIQPNDVITAYHNSE